MDLYAKCQIRPRAYQHGRTALHPPHLSKARSQSVLLLTNDRAVLRIYSQRVLSFPVERGTTRIAGRGLVVGDAVA